MEINFMKLINYVQKRIKKIFVTDTVPEIKKGYLKYCNTFIRDKVELISNGADISSVLKGFDGTKFGERVAEYCVFADWIRAKQKTELLDVGCVLNNSIVTNLLRVKCNSVWFCNVAVEPEIFCTNPVYYHISSLEESFPLAEKFKLVTCFSTIEHIGYDNSQYGKALPQKYFEPNPIPLYDSIKKLSSLVAENGSLLISVPFGKSKLLKHPGTFRFYSQLFDKKVLTEAKRLLEINDFEVELKVFAAEKNGWIQHEIMNDNYDYGKKTPGAEAVAFLIADKKQ